MSLSLDKQDAIRAQSGHSDWSAHIVESATIEHFDQTAVQAAKTAFIQKHRNRFEENEVMAWSNEAFLNRAKLTKENGVTRAALLLLGRPDSPHLLSPHPVQKTWKLEGPERAYEHFGPPFLLNTTALYQRIRNIQMRILPDDQLLAIELAKYDQGRSEEAIFLSGARSIRCCDLLRPKLWKRVILILRCERIRFPK